MMPQKRDLTALKAYDHGELAFVDSDGYPFIAPLKWKLDTDLGEIRAPLPKVPPGKEFLDKRCRLLFHSHNERMGDLRQVQVSVTAREQDKELRFKPLRISESRFALGPSPRSLRIIFDGKRGAARYRRKVAHEIFEQDSGVFADIGALTGELTGAYLEIASRRLGEQAHAELATLLREKAEQVPRARLDQELVALERAVAVHNWLMAETVALSFLRERLGDDFHKGMLSDYVDLRGKARGRWGKVYEMVSGAVERSMRTLMPGRAFRKAVERYTAQLGRFQAHVVDSDDQGATLRVTNCPVWSVGYLSPEQREDLCRIACRHLSHRHIEEALGVRIVSVQHTERGCTKRIERLY